MRREIGRRAFVGTVAAGLPLLATRTGLLAQGSAIAHDHVSLAETDPVIDQIVRQIALVHNGAQAGPRAAHTRALAMQLRMLATYGKQRGLDDETRTTLRDVVDREGRNAVLYAPPDLEARHAMMRKYGFRLDERANDVPLNPTHAQREAALDALLTNGITPVYEQLAATLDKASDHLDRRARGLVATQDDWYLGFCTELWNQYQMAQLMAIPWCLTARYFAWAAPSCLAMEGGAAVLLIVYIWEC